MQKTLTVNGKKFTAKKIASMFDDNNMTNGGDYIVVLNGLQFVGNYRQQQDNYFAPVCDKKDADCICLYSPMDWYTKSIWIEL